MSRSAHEYLQHILDERTYLIVSSNGLGKDTLIQDETLKRAYVPSIEVIREAVKNLPDGLQQKYTEIDWQARAGMRDRLIHDYFGINYDIVWDVVINKVPEFRYGNQKNSGTRISIDTLYQESPQEWKT